MATDIAEVVEQTQAYYDGPADEIYRRLWGDNVHMGTWQEGDTLQDAMARSNERMAQSGRIAPGTKVLDVGSGYGAAAIYLARTHDCHVVGLNLSERENDFARLRVSEEELEDRVEIRQGDFHDLPFEDESFDVLWSQEALLHAVDKRKVLHECFRVVKPQGRFVLSDLLMRDHVAADERETLYARVGTPEMWDFGDYAEAIEAAGFEIDVAEDWTRNVAPTYAAVRSALEARQEELRGAVPNEQIQRTMIALGQWVEAGEQDKISHGFFAAVRPD
jgi:sarcosine/dimethylglycine N-methyltransferase